MSVEKTSKGLIINEKIVNNRDEFLRLNESEREEVRRFRKKMLNPTIKPNNHGQRYQRRY